MPTNQGSGTFPANANAFLDAVETIAQQNIRSVESTNLIEDAFYEYEVDDGEVIEEAIIEMAEAQAFVPTAEGAQPDLSPLDPKLHIKYFNEWEEKQFKTKKDRLVNLIKTAIKKTKKRLSAIRSKLNDAQNLDDNKIMGELILSSIYKIKTGDSECELDDYYTGGKRIVQLNPYKTPAQNAESYFKKYSKQKRTLEMLNPQIEQSEVELKYFESVLEEINFADDLSSLDAIKEEMTEAGLIKEQKQAKKQAKPHPFRCYNAFGVSVKVGRNNVENDKLLHEAKPDDVWLHAKSEHSAFVIIEKASSEVNDEMLVLASEICAYYSSGREGGKVEIVYTKRKNVKKPPKSKPGFVVYDNFKSIIVNPKKHVEFMKCE